MSKGRKTLSRIDREIGELREEEAELEGKIAALAGRLERLQAREIEAFRELAVFRFGQDGADRVGGPLDAADKQLQRLRARRDAALAEVVGDLEAANTEIGHLEADRSALAERLSALQADIDARDEALIAELAGNPDYQARLEAVDAAEAIALEAERKAELANEDRVEKGRPYEADSLFMYLWNRHYGTPDYRSRGLIRSLDAWVARLIRYHAARPNYHMLLELPQRLGEHAERAGAAAIAETEALEAFEDAERDKAGILATVKQADAEAARLGERAQALMEKTAERTVLEAKRAAFNRGDDDITRSAIDTVAQALQDTRLKTLHRAARLTRDKHDDHLVEEIDDLRDDIEDLDEDLERLRRVERDIELKRTELEDVRGRFIGERMDDDRWEFDDDMIEDALKGLLRGAVNAATVWAMLRRRGRYRPGPSRPRRGGMRMPPGGGSIFKSGGRSRGGFGRGGFGGGGFRGGGGFGGGGFKTGGGF